MNQLSTEKRAQVVAALVEGNSLRSVTRMPGTHRGAVMKLLTDLGCACSQYTINIPAPTPAASGGGGAPSYWFLGFLVFAGILRWKLRKISTLT